MKRSKCSLSSIMLYAALPTLCIAQAPDTLWTRTYGGPLTDYGRSVRQTSDGGYILVGFTTSFGAGNWDIYVVKTDAFGDTIWTKTYGGVNNDDGWSIEQTADSGYIITGRTNSYGAGNWDVYLVKINSLGDTMWSQAYGGYERDACYSVKQTSDQGYILAGMTRSFSGNSSAEAYIIRTDSLGDTLWTKRYGAPPDDYIGYSVHRTLDGCYVVAGYIEYYFNFDVDLFLAKLDSLGDTLWMKIYGGNDRDYGYEVNLTYDGGYVVIGRTLSFGVGGYDYYLVRTDSLGDTLWTNTYGGTLWDICHSVQQTSDSGFIMVGWSDSFSSLFDYDFYLVKTDHLGNVLWTGTYGGGEPDLAFVVRQTSDGGYVFAGLTCSFGAGGEDFYLIKIAPDTLGINEQEIVMVENNDYTATILRGPLRLPKGKDCKVYDITGRVVEPNKIQPGIYFIEINGVVTQKVVKVR